MSLSYMSGTDSTSDSANSGIQFQVYYPQGVPLTPTSSLNSYEKGAVVQRLEFSGTPPASTGFFVVALDLKDWYPYRHQPKLVTLTYVDQHGKPIEKSHTMALNVHQTVCSLPNYPTLSNFEVKIRLGDPDSSSVDLAATHGSSLTVASLFVTLNRSSEEVEAAKEKQSAPPTLVQKIKHILS